MRPIATLPLPRLPLPRKPDWLRVRAASGEAPLRIRALLRERGLHTVCEEASCPNLGECWGGGTATFMLLGDTCTRACRFCHVKSGRPSAPDPDEPRKIAETVDGLGLTYVVLTTVDRDDLPDGGARHIADTVRALKRRLPELLVEVLVGDFRGDESAIAEIVSSGCEVYAHNVETVERLTPSVRDRRATFRQSLATLRSAKTLNGTVYTKSSIMLGLGESGDEVVAAMSALRESDVDVVTLGQYLQPTPAHLPVHEFVRPEVFDAHRERAERMGFLYAASGPLVRSSYRAGEHFVRSVLGRSVPARAAAGGMG